MALQSMDEVGRKMEIMSLPDVPAFPPAVAPSAWVPDILQSKDGVKHLASLLVDPSMAVKAQRDSRGYGGDEDECSKLLAP